MSNSASTARVVVAALARAGTSVMFGVPGGGPNLDVVGAAEAAGIRFVLTHTESAAAVMAASHAELTGAPGACLVTRGPGLANAADGVAHAYLDRQPIIVIADCVARRERDRIPHQRIDQTSMAASIAKAAWVVTSDNAAELMPEAIRRATTPPQGSVVLDFDPGWNGTHHHRRVSRSDHEPPRLSAGAFPAAGISALRTELGRARRPLLALGVGAVAHAEALREQILGRGVPVLTTYKAKGVVPDGAGECAGLLTGGTIESRLIERADLVVGVGLDPVEMIPGTWDYDVPTLLLDEWDADGGRYFEAVATITVPLATSLGELSALRGDGWPESAGQRARLQARSDIEDCGARAGGVCARPGVRPQEVVLAARAAAPAGTVATVDSGAHMLVAMPLWDVEAPGEVLISSGLATMGFALPAAIGAALARPGSRIVCFTGDGGLSMTLGELETLRRLDLDVTVVVFNDSALSLIEIKQQPSGQGGESAVRYRPTSFAGVAEAHGVRAATVRSGRDMRRVLADAFGRPGPMLVDVSVDPSPYREVLDLTRGEAGRRRPARA